MHCLHPIRASLPQIQNMIIASKLAWGRKSLSFPSPNGLCLHCCINFVYQIFFWVGGLKNFQKFIIAYRFNFKFSTLSFNNILNKLKLILLALFSVYFCYSSLWFIFLVLLLLYKYRLSFLIPKFCLYHLKFLTKFFLSILTRSHLSFLKVSTVYVEYGNYIMNYSSLNYFL